MAKNFIQKKFRLRKDVGLNFYIANFFFKYILRQNQSAGLAIHHTSTIIYPENITRGKHVFPGGSPGNYINCIGWLSGCHN